MTDAASSFTGNSCWSPNRVFWAVCVPALSAPTAALVTATVGKDRGDVELHNMPAHLTDTIRL